MKTIRHHGKGDNSLVSSNDFDLTVRDLGIGYLLVEDIKSSRKTHRDTESFISSNVLTENTENKRIEGLEHPPTNNSVSSTSLNAYFPASSIFRIEISPEIQSDIETRHELIFNTDSNTDESIAQTQTQGNEPDKRHIEDTLPQTTGSSDNLDAYFPRGSIFRIGNEERGDIQTPGNSSIPNPLCTVSNSLQLENEPDMHYIEEILPESAGMQDNLDAYFPRGSIFRVGKEETGDIQTPGNSSILNSSFTVSNSSQLENKQDNCYIVDVLPQSTTSSDNLDAYFPRGSIFRIRKEERENIQTSTNTKTLYEHKNTLETEVQVKVDHNSKDSVFYPSHIERKLKPLAGKVLHSDNNVMENTDVSNNKSTLPTFSFSTTESDQETEACVSTKHMSNDAALKLQEHNCYNSSHHGSLVQLNQDVKDGNDKEYLNVTVIPRSISDDNILAKNVKERNNNLQVKENAHLKSSSYGDLSSRSSKMKHILSNRPCVKFIKGLYRKRIDDKECKYNFVKTLTLPCLCEKKCCSCNSVSAIACAENGGLWLSFKDSKFVALTDSQGNMNKVINVGAVVDHLVTARNGDVYLSCSKAQIIKVIKTGDLDVIGVYTGFYTTQWYPQGLAISPNDGFLVACMTSSQDKQITNTFTDSCLLKFDIDHQNKEGCLLTNEKCFGYPLSVSISKVNHVVVWDYGLQCITILNHTGLVIAKLNEINEMKISPRIAISFDNDDNILILQERQPIITIFKLDDSPLSKNDVAVPALQNCNVSCMGVGKNDHIFVGGFDSIEVFKKQ